MGGYKNRILEVDLSSSQTDTTDVSGEDKMRFIVPHAKRIPRASRARRHGPSKKRDS